MQGAYRIKVRSQRWYMPLFLWVLNVAVVQAFIIYRLSTAHSTHPLTHLQFRKQLVVELIGDFTERAPQVGRVKVPPPASLLCSAHSPSPGFFVNSKGKANSRRACVVCGKETSRKCDGCQVPLCVAVRDDKEPGGYRDCFGKYRKRHEKESMPRLTAPMLAREAALAGEARTWRGKALELEQEMCRLRESLSRVRVDLDEARIAAPGREREPREPSEGGDSDWDDVVNNEDEPRFPALPVSPPRSTETAAARPAHQPGSPVPGRLVLMHRSTPPQPPAASRRRRIGAWQGPPSFASGRSFIDILSDVAADENP